MSDRERIRRPEPARTEPVRSVSGALRGEGAAATSSEPGGPGGPGGPEPRNPFAWPDDDPVSRAVRAGCDVVESAVRRGFGLGRQPPSGPPGSAAGPAGAGPWTSGRLPGSWAGPWSGSWTTGQWVDAMTGAVALWAQWLDAWSAMARSAMTGGAEAGPGSWPPAASPPGTPSPSPSPAGAAGALHLTVELRSPRAVSVELDLSSLPAPGPPAALEVHGLVAPAAAAAPPITDVTVALAGGRATVALGSIDHHPAGTYAGAVLAAGRACGTLTVRLA